MNYTARSDRYDHMTYRRCGKSGLHLPVLSLGLWHNFGGVDDFEKGRRIILEAFDSGITHFDLANNYGPPPGSAEITFGKILKSDLNTYRDELIISTKAGYLMWPGPYGDWGSKKYLMASLDQSLTRMGINYVDIFYSHRFDPNTPLEETMGALNQAVVQGKALYAGISNYPAGETEKALSILNDLGTPCLIHQEKYSLFQRQADDGLSEVLLQNGVGCIAFSPLAQGLLTDRYISGIPSDSRAAKKHGFLRKEQVNQSVLQKVNALKKLADELGMPLLDLALNWVKSQDFISSVLIGVSTVEQLRNNLKIIDLSPFDQNLSDKIKAITLT